MEYTIIGAEANLAARLQSIADPGGIVISYETYALVKEFVSAHALPAVSTRGISRQVMPYAVDTVLTASSSESDVIVERVPGLDLYLDPSVVGPPNSERIRSVLQNALASLRPT